MQNENKRISIFRAIATKNCLQKSEVDFLICSCLSQINAQLEKINLISERLIRLEETMSDALAGGVVINIALLQDISSTRVHIDYLYLQEKSVLAGLKNKRDKLLVQSSFYEAKQKKIEEKIDGLVKLIKVKQLSSEWNELNDIYLIKNAGDC